MRVYKPCFLSFVSLSCGRLPVACDEHMLEMGTSTAMMLHKKSDIDEWMDTQLRHFG